ncbi:deoxyguanosinetriphosphate triphosphohydrolase [Limibaculum sp. M0105]|uniref:Deoxyguanosinetriphosphate triphosphohydrolase-like protein n=1 Tax=Thermohalobaculum xanthum TaxID=2753746 RepID=A0A8J7M4W0_9RHOB|nr:deoxyguanosinetriphosphate triphosphohydrolase [Thermohalobaculum xanthum]MBK0398404.1 deoxyguanosinetriphosphate triphosphohydrolase [Thermohalobaculum xanthum]
MDEDRLAPFAAHPSRSRGRLHPEEESAHRSPFQRDRDRIIHSAAFRRLKHKTQVFVEHEGDYYRTRLTHSLEVAQIARTIARHFRLNEDLAESVALAHDLGHTPFGHTGEDALDACMKDHGGFDHNAQALKIVTSLEGHYAAFDGLNLTWETLEGIAKHNGPLLTTADAPMNALPFAIADYNARHDLALHTRASAEAQVAALSDDIAYVNHDLHDGLRAGLFTEAEAEALPLVQRCYAEVDRLYPGLVPQKRRHEALRRVFGLMVDDLLTETATRLAAAAPASMGAVQALDAPVVAFSSSMAGTIATIKEFLFHRMYRHYRVKRMRIKATRVVDELFAIFSESPDLMPDEWSAAALAAPDATGRARVVADYIAGMTDRFALEEHRILTDPQARA